MGHDHSNAVESNVGPDPGLRFDVFRRGSTENLHLGKTRMEYRGLDRRLGFTPDDAGINDETKKYFLRYIDHQGLEEDGVPLALANTLKALASADLRCDFDVVVNERSISSCPDAELTGLNTLGWDVLSQGGSVLNTCVAPWIAAGRRISTHSTSQETVLYETLARAVKDDINEWGLAQTEDAAKQICCVVNAIHEICPEGESPDRWPYKVMRILSV